MERDSDIGQLWIEIGSALKVVLDMHLVGIGFVDLFGDDLLRLRQIDSQMRARLAIMKMLAMAHLKLMEH